MTPPMQGRHRDGGFVRRHARKSIDLRSDSSHPRGRTCISGCETRSVWPPCATRVSRGQSDNELHRDTVPQTASTCDTVPSCTGGQRRTRPLLPPHDVVVAVVVVAVTVAVAEAQAAVVVAVVSVAVLCPAGVVWGGLPCPWCAGLLLGPLQQCGAVQVQQWDRASRQEGDGPLASASSLETGLPLWHVHARVCVCVRP